MVPDPTSNAYAVDIVRWVFLADDLCGRLHRQGVVDHLPLTGQRLALPIDASFSEMVDIHLVAWQPGQQRHLVVVTDVYFFQQDAWLDRMALWTAGGWGYTRRCDLPCLRNWRRSPDVVPHAYTADPAQVVIG